MTGTCETSCTTAPINITDTSAVGTTCPGSVYGNVYPSSSTGVQSFFFNLEAYLIFMILMGVFSLLEFLKKCLKQKRHFFLKKLF